MVKEQVLEAAAGWMELGLPDEALRELSQLQGTQRCDKLAMEVRLAAEMACRLWNAASETALFLCRRHHSEPEYFLRAAYCLHETGDTEAARTTLLQGPKQLLEYPVFHYNLACYMWILGDSEGAHRHLARAFAMDERLREWAKKDEDLRGLEWDHTTQAGSSDSSGDRPG